VKNVEPHILFKHSMTHKTFFLNNLYVRTECR